MVNLIVSQAVETGASDIHIEPGKATLLIRNRVDGLLRQSLEAPKWVQGPVISRIKVMAHMDIAEKRLPQDGRVAIKVGQKSLDLRVSTVPGSHGEKVVIRVLDSTKVTAPIESMGFDQAELEHIQELISRPQGIVLVTGPTGAGKTSTLYGMLNSLHSVERNIATIEDPIEYELAGINQTAVQEKIGLTFGGMLRALLRQDPDVIMLGEMRDAETTNIALQASITGHLVLSTMHTSNAVATVTRLRNIGVPSYVIASAVNGILAQRLVRAHLPALQEAVELRPSRHGASRQPDEHDEARVLRRRRLRDVRRQRLQGPHRGLRDPDVLAGHPRARVRRRARARRFAGRRWPRACRHCSWPTLNKVRAGGRRCRSCSGSSSSTRSIGERGRCPSCGCVTEPDFLACPACACRLAPACPSCDRKVMEHWKACPYCCTRLDQPSRKPRAEAQAAPVAVSASAGARTTKAPRKVGGPTLAASR